MPSFENSGASRSESRSTAPDAESIETDTTSIISVGSRETPEPTPSFIPDSMSDDEARFEKTATSAAKVRTSGAVSDERTDTISFLRRRAYGIL